MAIFLSIVVGIAAVLALLLVLGRREHAVVGRELRAITATPVQQARKQAEDMLMRPSLFKVQPAAEASAMPGLPSDVAGLFAKYEDISRNEFWLGHAALREPARVPGYIKIGGDSEFEEVLVRPGEETIWLSYPEDTLGSKLESLPSVWHKLLLVAS